MASTASSICGVRRHHDDDGVGALLLHPAQRLQPVHPGHALVEERRIEPTSVTELPQSLFPVRLRR